MKYLRIIFLIYLIMETGSGRKKTKNLRLKIILITKIAQDLVVKKEINLNYKLLQYSINNNIFFDVIVNKNKYN
jgi:hypothetical protein